MTRSKYITLAKEAKERDIKERWLPRILQPDPVVPSCKIHYLHSELGDINQTDRCQICIVQSCDADSLFWKWEYEYSIDNRMFLAQRMVDFLTSWDIEAWADKLVEKGILERD